MVNQEITFCTTAAFMRFVVEAALRGIAYKAQENDDGSMTIQVTGA